MTSPARSLPLVACLLALAVCARAQEADVAASWQRWSPAAAAPVGRAVREQASELVLAALQFLDTPYRRGGSGAQGFDCSGFTRHVFEQAMGVVLPRRADEQAHAPQVYAVRRDALEPGDLVFFNTLQRTFSHVGIYLGDGRFIHAPRSGSAVRIESLSAAYWARRYTGARRAANPDIPLPGMAD